MFLAGCQLACGVLCCSSLSRVWCLEFPARIIFLISGPLGFGSPCVSKGRLFQGRPLNTDLQDTTAHHNSGARSASSRNTAAQPSHTIASHIIIDPSSRAPQPSLPASAGSESSCAPEWGNGTATAATTRAQRRTPGSERTGAGTGRGSDSS